VNLVALAKGAKPGPFAKSPFTEIDGRFSPDGRWIAYSSDESGRMDVYVQPFPRSGSIYRMNDDVTSDGARFLVNTLAEGAGSPPINVVLNWPAGLKT